MATIVANGNRSVISPAYADTDNGYFEHALLSGRPTPNVMANKFNARKDSMVKGSTKGFADKMRPMVFGPSTVYDANGEPWESAYWMRKGEHPVENPDKSSPYKLVTKDHAARIEARLRAEGKNAFKDAKGAASNAVSSGVNKVTDAVDLERRRIGVGAQLAQHNYDREHGDKGNAFGRTLAGVKGAASASAAGKAVDLERRRIGVGARVAQHDYDREHGDKGNAFGRTLAGVKGGIGASAVGRAGKAAFNTLMTNIGAARDTFDRAIKKYISGENASANRKAVLEAGGALIGKIRSAIGMLGDEGGRQTIGRNINKGLNSALGTAAGVASGIAKSNIGKAAIKAGEAAYGAVKDKVGNALDAIGKFFSKFRKKEPTRPTGGLNRTAASV